MSETVIVYKCSACGDVFPLHETDEKRCPSCGSLDLNIAHEPLL